MAVESITPEEARRLVAAGATLVDIREADEYAREHIPGALHAPLSALEKAEFAAGEQVVFHCKSGGRTLANAERLRAAAAGCDVWVVDGGLENWKKAGLPVEQDRRPPIELMRQVQITAGGIAATGALFALLSSPWFAFVPLLVGGGLVFAGVTGRCGMAALLKRAPWNQRAFAAATKR